MELCFSHPRFRGLFWAQLLGALNDNIFKNALIVLVLHRGWTVWGLEPKLFAIVAGLIFFLPFLLFSAQAGQLADRVDKSKLVKALKSLEIAIAAVAVMGLLSHRLDLLLISLFGFAAQSAFFGPVKYAILPQLLEESKLLGGNALVETATSLAILIGTMTGVALAAWDPRAVAVVIVALALVGRTAASLLPSAPSQASPATRRKSGWWAAQKEVLRLTWETKPMLLTVLGVSWFWLFGGTFLTLIPLYSTEILGGSEGTTSLLLVAFSVGIAIGSQLCERLSAGRLELGWVPFGSLGMTLFALDFSYRTPTKGFNVSPWELLGQPGMLHLLADLTGVAISGGMFIVPLYTFLQKRSRPEVRSRLIAGNNLWNSIFLVGSTGALFASIYHGVTMPQIIATLAAANFVVSFLAYRQLPEFVMRLVVVLVTKICYSMRVRNSQGIPQEGAYLVVANHVTFVDWLFLASGTDRPVKFVMTHTFYYLPVVHYLFRDGGAIPIASRKTHPEIFDAAFEAIHQALQNGEMVVIFPEGKLTLDGHMDEFRKGVEAILSRDPVPVIPMALKGLWGTRWSKSPDRRFHFRPPIELVVGEALAPEGLTASRLQEEVAALRGPGIT